jgi:periplasmic divalent cation tolerance protein
MTVDYIVISMTAANRDEAQRIGTALVEEKLVACANIVGDVHSVYWWQGKIESAAEVMVLFKTRAELFPAVTERIRELHSYQVPEIIALPIVAGTEEYLSWISGSTAVPGRADP